MEDVSEKVGSLRQQSAPALNSRMVLYVEAQRGAILFERFEFDALIGEDHPARVVWAYAQQVDLSCLVEWIRAGVHSPGHPPADPRVVMALWLYACIEGVGSARQLERLSETDHGFRWLRADVPLNYQLLADFRWQAAVAGDRLLAQGVAALWSEGLVSLASLSEDGIRIRASTSNSSFRRLATLDHLLREVAERIARLRQEIDGAPDISNRRLRQARQQALRQ